MAGYQSLTLTGVAAEVPLIADHSRKVLSVGPWEWRYHGILAI